MGEQGLNVIFGNEFDGETARIIGIAKIRGTPDARSHARREQTHLESVQAKVALSGIPDRRPMTFSVPVLAIFVVRLMLPRGRGALD